jgi:hypothetical protein
MGRHPFMGPFLRHRVPLIIERAASARLLERAQSLASLLSAKGSVAVFSGVVSSKMGIVPAREAAITSVHMLPTEKLSASLMPSSRAALMSIPGSGLRQ